MTDWADPGDGAGRSRVFSSSGSRRSTKPGRHRPHFGACRCRHPGLSGSSLGPAKYPGPTVHRCRLLAGTASSPSVRTAAIQSISNRMAGLRGDELNISLPAAACTVQISSLQSGRGPRNVGTLKEALPRRVHVSSRQRWHDSQLGFRRLPHAGRLARMLCATSECCQAPCAWAAEAPPRWACLVGLTWPCLGSWQ